MLVTVPDTMVVTNITYELGMFVIFSQSGKCVNDHRVLINQTVRSVINAPTVVRFQKRPDTISHNTGSNHARTHPTEGRIVGSIDPTTIAAVASKTMATRVTEAICASVA